MKINFFDLNIEKGKQLNSILEYVRKNDFDILSFQEVGAGKYNEGGVGDLFEIIKEKLNYDGVNAVNLRIKGDPDSYVANSIFYKKDFQLIDKNIIWMNKYFEIDSKRTFPSKNSPRNALGLTLKKEDKEFQIVCTHLAWGPNSHDEDYKVEQGKVLYDYMKNVKKPFILSGDFNVDKNSQVVKWIDTVGRNLAVENNIKNTLNPNLHKAKHLFPPGLAVDFVYIGNGFEVEKFELVEEDLSDHYGFSAVFEIF